MNRYLLTAIIPSLTLYLYVCICNITRAFYSYIIFLCVVESSIPKDVSVGTIEKAITDTEDREKIIPVTSPLQSHNTTLAQQSQQLKNILMRAQVYMLYL